VNKFSIRLSPFAGTIAYSPRYDVLRLLPVCSIVQLKIRLACLPSWAKSTDQLSQPQIVQPRHWQHYYEHITSKTVRIRHWASSTDTSMSLATLVRARHWQYGLYTYRKLSSLVALLASARHGWVWTP